MGQEGSHFPEFSPTEEVYIYCVQLPFVCRSFSPSLPATFTAVTTASVDFPRLYQQLPQQFPHYSVVKVGMSKEPAQRLCTIMKAFKEFGVHDTQFHCLCENDSPEYTIEKGKREEKVVFIRKCRNLGNAENKIRQIIGHSIGQDIRFQDQFTQALYEDKQEYVKQVGKTEWVLIKTNLLEWIQSDFRHNWNMAAIQRDPTLSVHCPTGEQFCAQIFSLCFMHEQNQQHSLPQDTVAYEVEIRFPPTNFTFSVSIQNPLRCIPSEEDEEAY